MIKTIEKQLIVTLSPKIVIKYQPIIQNEIINAFKKGFAPPGVEKVNQITDPLELGMLFIRIINWCFDNNLVLEIIETEAAIIYLDIVRFKNHYDKDEIKELRSEGYHVEVLKSFKSYALMQILNTYICYFSEMRKNKCTISIPVAWAILNDQENASHQDLSSLYAAIFEWEDLIEGVENPKKLLVAKLLSSN
jgi:hypothetical protein